MKLNVMLYDNYSYEKSDYSAEYESELSVEQRASLSLDDYINELLVLYYEDFCTNLKYSKNNCPCVVVGVLGLWHGKQSVHRQFNTVREAIQICVSNMDSIIIKQVNGHLEVTGFHHDGSNHFTIHLLNDKGINTINGNLTKKHYHRAINGYIF